MSNLLKEQYQIRSNFLIFKSVDGKPVRAIYPSWGKIYPKAYNTLKLKHRFGNPVNKDLEVSKENSDRKRCLAEVKSYLSSCDPEFYKQVYNMLDPVSLDAKPIDGRKFKAYGIHSALYSGMEVDYDRIIKEVKQIQEATFTNPTKANHLKNLLTLELKQSNYIASLMYAPTSMSAKLVETRDELAKRLGLKKSEVNELTEMLDNMLNNNLKNVHTYIDNATKIIESGKFLLPRDDEAIKKACYDYPRQAIDNAFNKLADKDLSRVYGSKLDMAKAIIIDINKNYNNAISVPSPTATHDIFRDSAFIDDIEARETRNNLINGQETPDMANPDEVALLYDSFEENNSNNIM